MDTNLKTTRGVDPPKPSEAEVVQALVEVEHATQTAPQQSGVVPPNVAAPTSWISRQAPLLVFMGLLLVLIVSGTWLALRMSSQFTSSRAGRPQGSAAPSLSPTTDPAMQADAEGLLQRVVAGEPGAADHLIAQSSQWIGKTQRTPKADQLITAGINSKDMHVREASLQAQLAFDGVPLDEDGFTQLEQAAGNPQQRTWALWLLGAIGNRGVDPVHAAKIIEAYLSDPKVPVRVSAVEGLALLGTDETIPMLLDRFRNDPAPGVQEQAACGMAESGMYTHAQRMVAAASLVGWVDDSLLSQQQHIWAAQALHDISGQSLGSDGAAWRSWYEGSR